MKHALVLIALLVGSFLVTACGGERKEGPDVERRDAALAAGLAHYENRNFEKARVEFRNAMQADPKSAEALYQSGRVAERLGEFRAAGGFYQEALNADATHIRARADLARGHLYAGLPDRALEIVQAGMEQSPDDPHLLTVRGAARAVLRDVAGAFQDAERAVQLDPRSENAVLLLAGLYNTSARSDRARELLEKAVVDLPRSAEVRLAIADLYASLGMASAAEAQLRTLMQFEPDEPGLALKLARLLVADKRIDAAEQVMRDAIRQFPAERELRRALVDMLVATRGVEAAERQLKAFAEASPEDAEATFALAQFYVAQGQRAEGERVYHDVIAREQTRAPGLTARARLAALRMQDGDREGARKLVDAVLAVSPQDGEALFVRGSLALAGGDPRTAIADMRLILRDRPEAAGALRVLGRAHDANGEVDLAIESMRRAVEADAADLDAQLELARLMIDHGRAEQTRDLLDSVSQWRPGDPAVFDLQFKAAVATRDMDAARSAAESLRAARPESPVGHFYGGIVLEASGRTAEAEAAYRKSLELNPAAVEPTKALANLYVRTDRVAAAIRVYDAFAARNPQLADPLIAKGELLLRQRRYADADAAFGAALERAPTSWLAHRGLAFSAAGRGDLRAAESILVAAIPKSEQPQALRADLAELYVRTERIDRALATYEQIVADAPQLTAAKSRLAMLLAANRADGASLTRAEALTSGFERSGQADLVEAYGFVKLKRGDANGAVLALQRALDLAPGSTSVLYHLGLAQIAAGAADAGRASLERVIAGGPATPRYADAKAAIERAGPPRG